MRWTVGVGAGASFMTLALAAMAGIVVAVPLAGQAQSYEPLGAKSVADIPEVYLQAYLLAGSRYGLDWAVLAGIGKVECDHGRDPDPSCTKEGSVNPAGAGGPAQFLAQTWRRFGVDGNGDGVADRWNPLDAIFSMANYLRASGAPGDYTKAIYAYNHARWYVERVQRWAAVYRAAAAASSVQVAQEAAVASQVPIPSSPGYALPSQASGAAIQTSGGSRAVELIPGTQAELSPYDGHLALIPEGVPAVVQAMLIAGDELQDLPYGPGGHPDPRGATSEDCSSAVNYVLYRSGVRSIAEIVRDNPLAQDYTGWGAPGPGRWVTIYATASPTAHVFVVIAGLRLDTSHRGTDLGPNRLQDGPRWRLFDGIPTWAHWSVRHPPGL